MNYLQLWLFQICPVSFLERLDVLLVSHLLSLLLRTFYLRLHIEEALDQMRLNFDAHCCGSTLG